MNIFKHPDRSHIWELHNSVCCLRRLMTGLHVWLILKLKTEGQRVNVTKSLCHAHLTDPCWRWYCALAGGWVHGRWFGGLPWYFPPCRPMMAPAGPSQMLSSPLWRYWCKSICQRLPWCGRDQGLTGCWWCPVCVLQSNTLHTCIRRDKVRSEWKMVCICMFPHNHSKYFLHYTITLNCADWCMFSFLGFS